MNESKSNAPPVASAGADDRWGSLKTYSPAVPGPLALDWVITFSSSAVLISGYVLRVLLTSVGQSRDGGQ